MKRFRTKYGYFSDNGREYVITTPRTPRPWINVLSNGDYGLTFSQTGSGYSWRTHAQLNRLTRWEQDLIRDEWGKYIYLRDEKGNLWSAGWKPVCAEPERYTCRHGIGYSVIASRNHGIDSTLLVFVPNDAPAEVWQLKLRNTGRRPRTITLTTYLEWGLGQAPDWHREFHKSFIETRFDADVKALFATKRLWEVPGPRGHWNADWPYTAFHACDRTSVSYDTDKESVLGMYGSPRDPAGSVKGKLRKKTGSWLDPVASLQTTVTIGPGAEETVCFVLGAADSADQARAIIARFRTPSAVSLALADVAKRWDALLGTVHVHTPDDAVNLLQNIWLKYQAICGRLWARTAYYQTGGAYGFRDQLQDSQVMLAIDPARTLEQIRLHARHQFADGSVYHWWHPISEIGLHNNMTDNLLWLPFVVRSYLEETADLEVLDLREPFVDQAEPATLYEHCVRAIDRVLTRFSVRGLPLIGQGDWNDGLSAVGIEMKGESVWLGHFLHKILNDVAPLADARGDATRAATYRSRSVALRKAINDLAWDGAWYYRATRDDGQKVGSAENTEGRIFLNAQTWSVIAGVADDERGRAVMDQVEKQLEYDAGPILLHPAYATPDPFIGYLSRYAPGMRENGGVYTHAATWVVIAEAMLGRAAAANRLYAKILPINRGTRPDVYVAEPYVTPGNIEGPASPHEGRGGWTWYTGSAAWLFKVGLEWILGVRPTIAGLVIDPSILPAWKGYEVTRQFRGVTLRIAVRNPRRVSSGVAAVQIDGVAVEPVPAGRGVLLPAFAPGETHDVHITLGPPR